MKKKKKHHIKENISDKREMNTSAFSVQEQESASYDSCQSKAETDDDHDNPYAEIHEKAEGIPEILAEDICEAISDAKEREEKRNKKSKRHPETITFRHITLAIAFGVILYWALSHTSGIFSFLGSVADVFSPIIVGCCIAFVLNLVLIPIEDTWERVFGCVKSKRILSYVCKIKRPVCLVVSTLVTVGFICGIFLIVIPELAVTFGMFAEMMPELIRSVAEWFKELTAYFAEKGIELPQIIPDSDKAVELVSTLLRQKGQQMIDTTFVVTASVFSVVFDSILSIVFAFYVLAKKEVLAKKVKSILYAVIEEEKADTVVRVANLANSTFTKFVIGQVTEAVIIGVLCWMGMMIFRMPYATVISVVVGATALIPIFGAFVGASIGTLLILAENPVQALWFIVFIIILQQLETNLIYPKVVGKSIGLPGILVLASVTIGGAVFGFAGIVLGVPVCSVIYCVFNEFVEKRIEDRDVEVSRKKKD